MNLLPLHKRLLILRSLIDGMSVQATVRLTGASKNTILKLLCDLGPACANYQSHHLKDLDCRRIEVDEIWSFVYAKDRSTPHLKRKNHEAGSVWTWVAIDPETKLVPSWRVGPRSLSVAREFLKDLKSRLRSRVQLTSDNLPAYQEAMWDAFGPEVDYAVLAKQFGPDKKGFARCIGTLVEPICGKPIKKLVSTSMIERQNLTMRTCMRRFTRRTNAFSKKLENHRHAVNLYFMYYNFCRIHQTLRVTPAMEAGVTEKLWDLEDVLKLL